jgi:hypothetical protein
MRPSGRSCVRDLMVPRPTLAWQSAVGLQPPSKLSKWRRVRRPEVSKLMPNAVGYLLFLRIRKQQVLSSNLSVGSSLPRRNRPPW